MDPDSGARTLYLVLLGAFLLLILFQTGFGIGRLIRALLFWGLVLAGLATAYTVYQDEIRTPGALSIEGDTVVIDRAFDGHFHVELAVNGVPTSFIVDTGASDVVLSREAAAAADIDPDTLTYIGRARTANGIVRTAPVRLQTLSLAGTTLRDVRATVNAGALEVSLLGMSFLDRFSRIEIAGDEMRLIP